MINDEEKDLYIKSKIKDGDIPEKIDDIFNNSIKLFENKGGNYMKENNKKINKKQVVTKRIVGIAACAVIALGGGNIYATTHGYDNIFFMIKELASTGESVKGKEQILSDRDITISYQPIEIAEGIKIQINRLVVKDNEAKLYLKIDKSESDLNITPFSYIVKDEDEKEICNYTSSKQDATYNEELKLEGLKQDTQKIILEVKQNDGKTLVEFNVDLENKQIEVIGTEKELEKISEEELKQYLSAFALLNYEDSKVNSSILDEETLENVRKLMVARQIAELKNIEILTGDKYNDMSYSINPTVVNPEKMNNIMKSFTDIKLDKDGLVKCDVYYRKEKIKNSYKYVSTPNTDFQGNISGLCIDIKDIMYSNGIYTVTFTYSYPTSKDEKNNKIEELTVYEMTIGLTINEDTTYSKYRVSSKMDSTVVKIAKTDNNEDNKTSEDNKEDEEIKENEDNKMNEANEKNEENTANNEENIVVDNVEKNSIKNSVVGTWWRTYNKDHEESTEFCLQFRNDGTFIEQTAQERNQSGAIPLKITGQGTYEIKQDNMWDIIELTYDNGEKHELLYGQKGTTKDNKTKLHYSAGQQVFTKFTYAN